MRLLIVLVWCTAAEVVKRCQLLETHDESELRSIKERASGYGNATILTNPRYTTDMFYRDIRAFHRELFSDGHKDADPFIQMMELVWLNSVRKKALTELESMKLLTTSPVAVFAAYIISFIYELQSLRDNLLDIATDAVVWTATFDRLGVIRACVTGLTQLAVIDPPSAESHTVQYHPWAAEFIQEHGALGVFLQDFERSFDFLTTESTNMLDTWENSFENVFTNETAISVEDYRDFIQSFRREMDLFVAEGIAKYWVIGRGSLMAAMRYGQQRGALPSGTVDVANDREGLRSRDLDIYIDVHPSNWTRFNQLLTQRADSQGCRFCGFQTGWKLHTFLCHCHPFELDVTRIRSHRLSLTAVPASLCILENVELPCPMDVGRFITQLWPDMEEWTECPHLPPIDKYPNVTKEDVDFIWRRAQELYEQGYNNFGRYFEKPCKTHPLGAYAHSLYEELATE